MAIGSVFSIIITIVMALAIIALTMWVGNLSRRVKELTDAVMMNPIPRSNRAQMNQYEDYEVPQRRPEYQQGRQEMRRAPMPQRNAPQRNAPQRSQAPARQGVQRPMPQQGGYAQDYGSDGSYDYQSRDGYNAGNYGRAQTTPSGMRQSYNSTRFNDSFDDEFFENYRERDDRAYNRGRSKPAIPFGADKSLIDNRRDSYVGNVADFDYDPDSIDFTRVQGYRRTGGRY